MLSSEREKQHREKQQLMESSCEYRALKIDIEFTLCWDIFELEIKITVLSVIIFSKELRLYNAIDF